jgi:hypothetical protein
MIVFQQFEDLPAELQANGSREQHTVFLDNATDLVLDIASGNESGICGVMRPDGCPSFGRPNSTSPAKASASPAGRAMHGSRAGLRRARPAPAACAALCLAMDGRRQSTSMFAGADRMAARIRRRAGDDGPKAPLIWRIQ